MKHQDRVQLTEKIRQRFNMEGLKELCFQLGIEYDDLAGTGRSGKARELVLFCDQKGRLEDLIATCEKMRPKELWRQAEITREPQPEPPLPKPVRAEVAPWYIRFPGWGWALAGLIIGSILIGTLWTLSLNEDGSEEQVAILPPTATAEITVVPTDLLLDATRPISTDTPISTRVPMTVPTSTTATSPTYTATPKPSIITPTPALSIGSTRIRPKDGAVMVYVPAGEFKMGSDGNGDELPIHAVHLDAYWIDRTEVTNGMYTACVAVGSCAEPSDMSSRTYDNYYLRPDYVDYPVIYVDWYDATAYCEWAGGRLPTEAEWEKAASWDEEKQETRTYPWGGTIDCSYANHESNNDNYCVGDTTAVGSYPDGVSPYGALDMTGNVWEWVNDFYDADYYSKLVYDNPTGPAEGSRMVLRGGSWSHRAFSIRVANRDFYEPAFRYYHVGFRCTEE